MADTRFVHVADALATAWRLVDAPDREACHLSIEDRLGLAVYAIVADGMIRGAGLAYEPAPFEAGRAETRRAETERSPR